jgi:glycosyltransferase involved in cell wall biosynthesis
MKVLMMPDYRAFNPYQKLLADALAGCGAEVVFPAGYRRGLPLFRAARDAGWPDVLHLHWTTPFLRARGAVGYALYAAKVCLDLVLVRLAGTRVVWTMHNFLSHEAAHPRTEAALCRAICRIASRVVVHGGAGRDYARAAFGCPDRKIAVIPLGHYRAAYGPALPRGDARARLGLAPGARVFLCLGLLRPYKGLEALLEAWGRLRPEGATLLVVGQSLDPAYGERLRRLAAATPGVRLDDRYVPDDEIPVFFSAADAAVLPFLRVLTSSSVILAMSYGVPVVAPRVGDIPEVLQGADDLLFDPGRPDALRDALVAALGSDLRPLADRTAAACGRFGWGPIAAETLRAYAPRAPLPAAAV